MRSCCQGWSRLGLPAFPWIAGQARQELVACVAGCVLDVPRRPRSEQRLDVAREHPVGELGRKVGLELGPAYAVAAFIQVAQEARDDALRINLRGSVRRPEIEEVAALLSLIERAQLRPEELVEVVRLDGSAAREPPRAHLMRPLDEVEHGEVLRRVDLDLEPQR